MRKLSLILDHSLPLFCLLIDFLFVNKIVIVRRHGYILFIVAFMYTILNFSVTVFGGNAIYLPLKWDSFLSYFLVFCCYVVGSLFFYGIEYLSRIK